MDQVLEVAFENEETVEKDKPGLIQEIMDIANEVNDFEKDARPVQAILKAPVGHRIWI